MMDTNQLGVTGYSLIVIGKKAGQQLWERLPSRDVVRWIHPSYRDWKPLPHLSKIQVRYFVCHTLRNLQ